MKILPRIKYNQLTAGEFSLKNLCVPRFLLLFLILFLVPFCLSGSCSSSFANLTATSITDLMSSNSVPSKERKLYKKALKNLVYENTNSFLRLYAHDVLFLLDQPTFLRKDGNVQTWQYKSDKCVIEFFFVGDAIGEMGNKLKVKAFEMRRRQVYDVPVKDNSDCLQSIL